MKENSPVSPKFFLKIPTSSSASRSIRASRRSAGRVSQEMIRASMIEAMYEHDWARGCRRQ